MKMRSIGVILLAGCTLLLAGCGSGGDTTDSTTRPPANVITRGDEDDYSLDALILAARESQDAWIRKDIARVRETDLATIRQKYPQLAEIRALPNGEMREMLVGVPSYVSWVLDWKAGRLTTGEEALDNLLREFQAIRVRSVVDYGDSVTFLVTFANPLNVEKLAERVSAVSPRIAHASINGLVGDGNNITFATSDGVREYTFSKGWGDCPSGCTNRHFWKVKILPDGSLTLTESGSPLPPEAGGGAL